MTSKSAGNNSQEKFWNYSENGNRNSSGESSYFGSAHQPSLKLYDLIRDLNEALGGYERVALWLGEKPKQFQKRVCATDLRFYDLDQHFLRTMDRAKEFGLEPPVIAILDNLLSRYGRAPSVSIEEGQLREEALGAMQANMGLLEKMMAKKQRDKEQPKPIKPRVRAVRKAEA